MLTQEILKRSSEIFDKIVLIRRGIHKFPELGFNEFKTSMLISGFLKQLGLDVTTGISTTGVTALLKGNTPGKTLAIRADIDALPITESNKVGYASQNLGVMHACGHDAHTAIVLGCAEILVGLKNSIKGNIKFIFQPGEEGLGGAKHMVDEGVLENPPVDSIIALHVNPDLKTGQVSVCPGPAMASPSEFTISILGKGGHAAQPHNAVDPIIIGANLINLFQGIITREKNPLRNAVLSVTYFNSGSSFNIIPDKAVIKGTVRTFDPELDKYISDRMEEMTASITKAMGASYEFAYITGYPPVINDKDLAKNIVNSFYGILSKNDITDAAEPTMLAEDFSYYAQKVPGVIFNLGCSKPDSVKSANLHSSEFNIDENCIKTGMQLLSKFTLDFLNKI